MGQGSGTGRRTRAATATLLLLCAVACGPELASLTTSEGDDASTSSDGGSSIEGSTGGGSTSTDSTGTGEAETTAALTETESGADCVFLCEPDMPSGPIPCDILAQDCPEGMKCESVDTDGDNSWDSNLCVPVIGDDMLGEPCTAELGATGVDTCAKGYVCWKLDENGEGTCFAHCTGTWEDPVCEGCEECVIFSNGVIAACLPGCDPLAQDCVGAQVCIGDPGGDGFFCVLDASGGMAPAGTPCEFTNVCNAGTMCANPDAVPHPDCAGSIGCCTPFCDYEQPGDTCDALGLPGVECVPYVDEPDESCAWAVGVCVMP